MRLLSDIEKFPKWTEFNWIHFEILNSLNALNKMIVLQNESFMKVREELDKKIKSAERENGHLKEELMNQYVDRLYGVEDKIIYELELIQDSSQVTTTFSIFESKLKLICDKINSSFNFKITDKTKSYNQKYWNYLKAFIGNDISSLENQFKEIKKLSVVRNIIVHQNLIATKNQYEKIKNINELNFIDSNNLYYLYSIDLAFINSLISKISKFFNELLSHLKIKTNQLLK